MKFKSRLPITTNRTTTTAILAGIGVAFAISAILVASLSALIAKNILRENSASLVFVVRVLAVLTGVLIGTGITKEKHLMTAGIITAGYLAVLLGLGIVLYDVSFKRLGAGVISSIIGCAISCIIRLKSQNKAKITRKIRV